MADKEIIALHNSKPPILIRAFLLLFIMIGLAIPIAVFIFWIDEIKIGFFLVTIPITWGTAIYLLRILLWNMYGSQVLEIHGSKVHHYFDYKYFKDKQLQFEKGEITLHSEEIPDGKNHWWLEGKFGTLHSPFSIDDVELSRLENALC